MKHKYSFDLISKLISGYFNMDPALLYKKSRKDNIVETRRIAMYFSRQLIRERNKRTKKKTPPSLKRIARHFNLTDHTTILYHIRRVEQLRKIYKEYDSDIRIISIHLKNGDIDYFKKNLPDL